MGNSQGRPLKFKSKKELQEKIEAYFRDCAARVIERRLDKEGNVISETTEPYTISGLALSLGCHRETLLNYAERDEFFDTIKTAKLRCMKDIETGALVGKYHGTSAIFNLKNNHGWKDEQHHDVTSAGKAIQGLAYLPPRHGLETDTETDTGASE